MENIEAEARALNDFLNSAPMVNGAPWHKLSEPYRERMRQYAEEFAALREFYLRQESSCTSSETDTTPNEAATPCASSP